jgi:4-hydroxy-tetrahydrodipicolinate synthase
MWYIDQPLLIEVILKQIPDGIWPTMITPFNTDGSIDYNGLKHLVDWFIRHGVDGLFAVCQSSEMFYLDLEERVTLAARTVEYTAGRVPVIASGHISDDYEEQAKELIAMSRTGIDALVLVTNRLCREDEDESVWIRNFHTLVDRLPQDITLGFYECPYPFPRLLSKEMLRAVLDTERFAFLKDTSCSMESMRMKLELMQDHPLKLFNANVATLLDSLQAGGSGFSGVMANFHPHLYSKLLRVWRDYPDTAERLQNYLSLASQVERQYYPMNAMYFLGLQGLPINLVSRRRERKGFKESFRREIEQFLQFDRSMEMEFIA